MHETSSIRPTILLSRRLTPPELDPRTAKAVWRDLCFLAFGCVALSIVAYVENHASEPDARLLSMRMGGSTNDDSNRNNNGIVDTGFLFTQPLYQWLKDNRDWNDFLAALNSTMLVGPCLYIVHVTAWKGDYSLSFRVIALQLLRAFCGWYTYLPPDSTYLNSYYDFPDIAHCLFQECSEQGVPEAMPFVSFFSGHCATMVVVGNHLWLNGNRRASILIHAMNMFQILRLLATRGHYSIDIIIGWYVAVYGTNPAGRLGRYYSRGATVRELLPTTAQEAFEIVTGVNDARNERLLSVLLQHPEVQQVLQSLNEDSCHSHELYEPESETTARLLQETAATMMQEQALIIWEQMNHLQEQARRHYHSSLVMPMDPVFVQGANESYIHQQKSQ